MNQPSSTSGNSGDSVLKALTTVLHALEPLLDQDRERVIDSVRAYFGRTTPVPTPVSSNDRADTSDARISPAVNVKASSWIQRSGLSLDDIQQVFTLEESNIEIIANKLPSAKRSDRVVDAYVLVGLQSFLQTGSPNFPDSSARSLCIDHGCYDSTNHSKYLSGAKNLFTGSKDLGWKLTQPGFKHGVDIIRKLANRE
ncbi:MAG TPA: hypothetical protein VEH27_18960 [Methylomirabilota bacterium]|nr:hypothetical protein [Methylomirabilota bacterium]